MFFKITKDTKAIFFCDTGYYRSKILESNEEVCSVRCPVTLLADSCIDYMASLEGREVVAEEILNSRHKLPIAVSPKHGIYFFPTLSKRNRDCAWFSYYHIANYYEVDNRTLVVFTDNTFIYVQASVLVFDRQFKRTSQLIAQLNRDLIFGPLPT